MIEKTIILSIKAEHRLICVGPATPVTVQTQGWGYLRISAVSHPDWPGVTRWNLPGHHRVTFMTPVGAILLVSLISPVGKAKARFAVPARNAALPLTTPTKFAIKQGSMGFALRPLPSISKTVHMPTLANLSFQMRARLSSQISKRFLYDIRLPRYTLSLPKADLLKQPFSQVHCRAQIQPWNIKPDSRNQTGALK